MSNTPPPLCAAPPPHNSTRGSECLHNPDKHICDEIFPSTQWPATTAPRRSSARPLSLLLWGIMDLEDKKRENTNTHMLTLSACLSSIYFILTAFLSVCVSSALRASALPAAASHGSPSPTLQHFTDVPLPVSARQRRRGSVNLSALTFL